MRLTNAINLLAILQIAFLVLSCTEKKQQQSTEHNELKVEQIALEDSIKVEVIAPPGTPVYLHYNDVIGEMLTLEKGVNIIKVAAGSKLFILDDNWQAKTIFIVNSGDSLKLYKESPDKLFWLAKSNDSLTFHKYNFSKQYRIEQNPITEPKWPVQRSFVTAEFATNPVKRESILTAEYKKNITYVEEYALKYKLDNEFKEEWKDIFKYEYLMKRAFIADRLNLNWPEWYIADIKSSISEFNRDDKLYLPDYVSAANLVVTLYAHESLDWKQDVDFSSRFKSMQNNLKGKTKDYLLTRYILFGLEDLTLIGAGEREQVLDQYYADCKDEVYKKHVKAASELSLKNPGILVNWNNQEISQDSFFNSFAHKYTYIDFWASWCAPCREQMPASHKLKEEFGPQGIKFVYISLDKNPEQWKKANQSVKIDTIDSYILPGNFKAELAKNLSIRAIPRYIIVDDKGKIVNSDAPHPSDPKARETFIKLLNN